MKFPSLLALLFCSAAHAAIDWPLLKFTPVVTGANKPVYVTSARDGSGRIFVVEQGGRVRIVSGAGFLAKPFLNVSDHISTDGERGLLSIAFPPNFENTQHFYANYTDPSGNTVISRFFVSADGNVANAGSEQVVLRVAQPYANHNGGQLQFGADGFLYIGMGDGGNGGDPENRAQDLRTLLGKMLRIDVEGGAATYTIPVSNPFRGRQNVRAEIWASGLRNPWRFSFDRGNGNLFIGDVGQDRIEEVDFLSAQSSAGQNFGWRLREGRQDFKVPPGYPAQYLTALTPPVSQYSHSVGRSVTGGYVYRGTDFQRMKGIYIFGDYATGRVFALGREEGHWKRHDYGVSDLRISSFGEDNQGEIYLADYPKGVIYHVEDSGLAWKPTATPSGGTFPGPRRVTLRTLSPDSAIHYTLDGSEPTTESPSVVSGQKVLITQTATLKARVFRSDLEPSKTLSASYWIR